MINDCICKLCNAITVLRSSILFFLNDDVFNIYHTLATLFLKPSALVRHYFIPLFCTSLGKLTIIIIDNDQRLSHG